MLQNYKNMYDLKGKVAIVTGGLGYLAFEFVSALAQNGANVVIADLSESKCKEKAKEISEQTGNRALRIKVDITNKRSIENMTDEVIKEFNKIDVLVNAAQAVTKNDYAPFEELTLEDWETALSVNLTGVMLCCQIVGKEMALRGGGTIINIASTYGVTPPDFRIYEGSNLAEVYLKDSKTKKISNPMWYSVTKAGVIMISKYLSVYWAGKKIRVNTLTPGGIYHPAENKTFVEKYSYRTPLNRKAKLNEMGGALVFLASDASSYVTGHNLVVDGGYTIW